MAEHWWETGADRVEMDGRMDLQRSESRASSVSTLMVCPVSKQQQREDGGTCPMAKFWRKEGSNLKDEEEDSDGIAICPVSKVRQDEAGATCPMSKLWRDDGAAGLEKKAGNVDSDSDGEFLSSPAQPGSVEDLDDTESINTLVESEVPDGGYGWIVVFAMFMINCCTWGVSISYGIYLTYYLSNDTFPGTTHTEYALIGGLSVGVLMLTGPIATSIVRRFGLKPCLFLGVAFETAALVGASFTKQKWQIFLAQAVAFGLGHGLLFMAALPAISQWFSKRRSTANGLVAAGGGVGGLAFTLGTSAAIRTIGLQWSFRVNAIVCFVINGICALLIKNRNDAVKPNQCPFDFRLLKRNSFKLILCWIVFFLLGYMPLLFSLADYAKSVGLDVKQAGIVAAMLSVGMCIGRPGVGILCDRYGRINMSMAGTILTCVMELALWIPADHVKAEHRYAMCIVFAIAAGCGCATMWTTVPVVCVEALGLKDLPAALSMVWLSAAVPCTFATTIALALRNPSSPHPYLGPQLFSAFMYFVAFLSIWGLRTVVLHERAVIKRKKEANLQPGRGMFSEKEESDNSQMDLPSAAVDVSLKEFVVVRGIL